MEDETNISVGVPLDSSVTPADDAGSDVAGVSNPCISGDDKAPVVVEMVVSTTSNDDASECL